MSQQPVTIPKEPVLKPAEDVYRLRREGIGFIEQMASQLWTDYNPHDPGITLLEALCYAITDLAYRAGWDIKDLLTPAPPADPKQKTNPYKHQAFFTARDILTVNPVTPADFRRLLIDLNTIRNAWIFGKECACDLHYYAWCEANQLNLSYQKPTNPLLQPVSVDPKGLYDVWLELEADPELGDLNDRKIEIICYVIDPDGQAIPVTLELRFPDITQSNPRGYETFIQQNNETPSTFTQTISTISAVVKRSPTSTTDITTAELRRYWRDLFYVSFVVTFDSGDTLPIDNVTLRLLGNTDAKNRTKAPDLPANDDELDLEAVLTNTAPSGIISHFRQKLVRVWQSIRDAKATLHDHRNLDEDFCRINVVDVEDVSVCADVVVATNADIEWVQAKIWLELERYFNPPIPFYSLQELLDVNTPVEEIFNGPALKNGFIKSDDLEAAGLKTVLRTSDIINQLMDIEGVLAVNELLLTKYDAEGNVVKGAADPLQTDSGLVFNTSQSSARWQLFVSQRHQPRLYLNLSRFLFYKNDLPFQPRMDEALATLTQLRGEIERPKIIDQSSEKEDVTNDLPTPSGTYRNPSQYVPVQHTLPLTYGVGPEGLPADASDLRKAQASQLKAYLMVFEQLLGNSFAQVANVAELFSLNPSTDKTYFGHVFSQTEIIGYDTITQKTFTSDVLQDLIETKPEFIERRNRFLDHLIARFGEQFTDYALMLTTLKGQAVAREQLITNKIAFLNAYPAISHDRGKAFNYQQNVTDPINVPGLKQRVGLLLGFPENDRAIVVEHLLLRPKFPGDALYPACTEGDCGTCGDEDPYSFRLTYIMPGWVAPFNENMAMRRFANRTIQQEIPAHLLGKICWVGNDGFTENPCDPVITTLAEWLETKGKTTASVRPTYDEACACAQVIYTAFSQVFTNWYADKTLRHFHPDALKSALETEFMDNVKPEELSCSAVFDNSLWTDVQNLMTDHFQQIATSGWQFERFSDAWHEWLSANAKIDWIEEQLQERIEAMLRVNIATGTVLTSDKTTKLCACATSILTTYGMNFYGWMDANSKVGLQLNELDFNQFDPNKPTPLTLCTDFTFKADTLKTLTDFLTERYQTYIGVSFWLRILLQQLSRLRNTYPGAILHDCDDGSDQNPVRLGSTALGSYPTQHS